MPNYKTHITVAAILSLFIYSSLGIDGLFKLKYLDLVLLIFIVFIYSQLPDIDHQTSFVTRILTAGLLFIALFFLAVSYINSNQDHLVVVIIIIGILTLIWVLRLFRLLKHRGFFHSFKAALIFSLPLLYLSKYYFFYGFVAYSSHLIADKLIKKRKESQKKEKDVTTWGEYNYH